MSRRGWLLFATMSVVWGVPYLMIRVAVEEVSAPMVVFVRTAVAAVILLPLALRGGQLAAVLRHWWPLLVFASLEIIAPWWLLSDAERTVTSSMTGLLLAAVPVMSVLVARLAGSTERLGAIRWLGLGIGFAGVAVLAAPGLRGGSPWAITEVLLTAVCYATGPLILARWLSDLPVLPMSTVCLGMGALVVAAPAVATWPDELPSGRVLAALAGLALICTAVAYVAFVALLREVSVSRAMVFTYVNPAVAIVAGVLILSEPLTLAIVVSFVLILAGSALATATTRASRAVPATDRLAVSGQADDRA
jgi:drug/metabolite transporter (DMT)-like permease